MSTHDRLASTQGELNMNEQQRKDILESCERIEVLNERVQLACKNILRILDNSANGRDPKDGVVQLAPVGDA